MALKTVSVIIFVSFVMMLKNVYSFPRDSSVAKTNVISPISDETLGVKAQDNITEKSTPISDYTRVWCAYVEATEDPVCQTRCLPKGYAYGLCINNSCSCI